MLFKHTQTDPTIQEIHGGATGEKDVTEQIPFTAR